MDTRSFCLPDCGLRGGEDSIVAAYPGDRYDMLRSCRCMLSETNQPKRNAYARSSALYTSYGALNPDDTLHPPASTFATKAARHRGSQRSYDALHTTTSNQLKSTLSLPLHRKQKAHAPGHHVWRPPLPEGVRRGRRRVYADSTAIE